MTDVKFKNKKWSTPGSHQFPAVRIVVVILQWNITRQGQRRNHYLLIPMQADRERKREHCRWRWDLCEKLWWTDIFHTLSEPIFHGVASFYRSSLRFIKNDLFIPRWDWSGRTTRKCLEFRHLRLCSNQTAGVTRLRGFDISHNLNERPAAHTLAHSLFTGSGHSLTFTVQYDFMHFRICKCVCSHVYWGKLIFFFFFAPVQAG